MHFVAKALYIPYSPYKLRLLADVVRGKSAGYALAWLNTYKTRRTMPLYKVIKSAVSNAKSLKNVELNDLIIKTICVDEGPVYKYFKPGSHGRAMEQKRRLCHVKVMLESTNKEKQED